MIKSKHGLDNCLDAEPFLSLYIIKFMSSLHGLHVMAHPVKLKSRKATFWAFRQYILSGLIKPRKAQNFDFYWPVFHLDFIWPNPEIVVLNCYIFRNLSIIKLG